MCSPFELVDYHAPFQETVTPEDRALEAEERARLEAAELLAHLTAQTVEEAADETDEAEAEPEFFGEWER